MSGALKRDEWKTVRLGDVATYVSDRIDASLLDTHNYVSVENLLADRRGIKDSENVPQTGRFIQYVSGDVLIGNIRPYLKKIWLAIHEGGTNGDVLVIRPNNSKNLSSEYLYHSLASDVFFNYAMQNAKGAKMPRGDKKLIMKYSFPLPPIDIQHRIADTLDKVTELITLRKTQLEKLDELVKARFVEMFGDPGENLYHWPVLTVRKAIAEGYIDKPLDGNHGAKHPKTSDYVSSGVPFIMANNIVDGCVDLERCAFISETQATSLDKGFAKDGDVLITHKGSIGNTAILKCSLPYVMLTPQVTYYRPINGLLPEFLKGYFDTSFFQSLIQNIASIGSTRAYIGITAQQDLPLCIPPFELQKKFAMFVNQIVLLKAPIQQSLDALETLRKSLMQEYFGQ